MMIRTKVLQSLNRYRCGDYELSMKVKSLFDESKAETREEMKTGLVAIRKAAVGCEMGPRTLEALIIQSAKRGWRNECELYSKELIKQTGKLSTVAFQFLLALHAKQGDYFKLMSVFKDFVASGYPLSPIICNTLLHGLSKYRSKVRPSLMPADTASFIESVDTAASSILRLMERNQLTTELTLKIMLAFGTHQNFNQTLRRLGHTLYNPQSMPPDILSACIRRLGNEGRQQDIENIIKSFKESVPPGLVVFSLIGAFTDSGNPSRALKVFCEFQQKVYQTSSLPSEDILYLLNVLSPRGNRLSNSEKQLLQKLHDNGLEEKFKPRARLAMQRLFSSSHDASSESIYVRVR
eukprot:TRINITY_DN13935_c0_g1_i1.p1 TRINITY_DN13935_c0_g1~~TRINITY_DN13935_c0_g1_i1.p1  ORF type:complete len:351 (+),score=48.14 TRINITY_DN13935_c0_g1_i1:133-1185(+)